jgi:serine protease Do
MNAKNSFVRETNLLGRTLAGGAALATLCALPLWAAEPPKITLDAKPLDRSSVAASYSPLIKRVGPCVVNISSTQTIRERSWTHPFLDDPTLRRFFGDRLPSPQRPQTRRSKTLGSGVIVTEDGYLLTNNHVVEGADKVEVTLPDGKTTYTARVVGRDPQTEVAVLKIEAKGLPSLPLADSDQLEVGDVVIAIGNPFGLGQTVTSGIISAVGRSGFRMVDYEDWIQTDAAINPGNSGGALVDTQGRLIGLNTFIVSESGGNQGVGFAIPVNIARSVLERLVTDGKVARGFLGVSLQPVTAALAKEFKLPAEAGALVSSVSPDSPAERAGMKDGDVVVELNGKPVSDMRHFRLMVSQTAPKTKVTMKVLREGKSVSLTATLGELPTNLAANTPEAPEAVASSPLDGLALKDLSAEVRRQLDAPDSIKGALVTAVPDDSPASTAGLAVGDIIIEVNRTPVADAASAASLARKAGDKHLLLRIWSAGGSGEGGTRYVVLEDTKP